MEGKDLDEVELLSLSIDKLIKNLVLSSILGVTERKLAHQSFYIISSK